MYRGQKKTLCWPSDLCELVVAGFFGLNAPFVDTFAARSTREGEFVFNQIVRSSAARTHESVVAVSAGFPVVGLNSSSSSSESRSHSLLAVTRFCLQLRRSSHMLARSKQALLSITHCHVE